ncbi:hypothetical protein EC973_001813 [Apophysomyces ossiformis]|uniref:Uncharacterized protein n=1 Tax=Apophysomyces ossiformis TaxID=679940 RepID=A0A8H7BJT7_9FUNG|nr:hypothetical protein EC973_001813 [Apophysomyces ossiformis]
MKAITSSQIFQEAFQNAKPRPFLEDHLLVLKIHLQVHPKVATEECRSNDNDYIDHNDKSAFVEVSGCGSPTKPKKNDDNKDDNDYKELFKSFWCYMASVAEEILELGDYYRDVYDKDELDKKLDEIQREIGNLNYLNTTALQYFYGIGEPTAMKLCEKHAIPKNIKVSELTDTQINDLTNSLASMTIESDLKRQIREHVMHHRNINNYTGRRHAMSLPVRGQRTRNNAKTAKRLNGRWVQRRGFSIWTMNQQTPLERFFDKFM